MTVFAGPAKAAAAATDDDSNAPAAQTAPAKRPPSWSLRNWPVRWKVVAIALVPLLLSMGFGGIRIYGAVTEAHDLRLAAERADVVPAIAKYMSALDVALLANSGVGDVAGANKNYDARRHELRARLADTDVAPDVRTALNTVLDSGQALLDKVASNDIGLRERVTSYAPILMTAQNAITGSVRVDSERERAKAAGLSRAVGVRGQMMMQRLMVTRGADLPEPELRVSMITLAGTEPSTLYALGEVLGAGSPEARTLQQQMVSRMAIMSDPASVLVNNPQLLRSIQTTDAIADRVIKDTEASLTKTIRDQAAARRDAAIRDTALILAGIATALVIIVLVGRSLIQPLRVLRDGALKVAHEDLEREIARVRAGDERAPEPLPVSTTEEIGQVAHAVDELHSQALLLAGEEARLRLLVNDMFETMSRRSRSLVDQQLALIDRLERNEEDPERLESLFRLDHLAARMRRNAANLLVLAGARVSREPRGFMPLAAVINAAASEVEDYRRVRTAMLPECTVTGAAAADVVHLFAELIDNALRYSPPTSLVRVCGERRNDGGVVVQVIDHGLGMTDGDRRMANIRLRAGGEVTPDNARHMGLFVVGRLADRHGMRVRLRSSATEERASGTTAEVYLPPGVLAGHSADGRVPRPRARAGAGPSRATTAHAAPDTQTAASTVAATNLGPADPDASQRDGPRPPVTPLPRRDPGSSGITDLPARPTTPGDAAEHSRRRPRREPARPWWEHAARQDPEQPPDQGVSDISGYSSARPRAARAGAPGDDAARGGEPDPRPADTSAEDVIYQRMLSEYLVDPRELGRSADLDWRSVWDRGWSAAAEAEKVPIRAHTDHGLPVRDPGARLVPGTALPETSSSAGSPVNTARHRAPEQHRESAAASNGGSQARQTPANTVPARDPDAIRASIGSHFGGVHAARSHARETNRGTDHE
ncbi:HAMP domain-containing protein [Mycobacterium sp. SM1]|uniref:ATP-binding protein n=1 Tax=Mycobacterium sp. SM1 TaxID=2816243 RepID=UPI001BD1276B|nr:ATP-binding protein [Mycobacterium sp. SM1]MBS4728945.1 HAMP domain-containing protein [Mycobacterium sp. SM1]